MFEIIFSIIGIMTALLLLFYIAGTFDEKNNNSLTNTKLW